LSVQLQAAAKEQRSAPLLAPQQVEPRKYWLAEKK
jgi:hypothetical protein